MIEGITEVLDLWLDSRLKEVHTCLPGKIDKYYGHSERKARVIPLIKLVTNQGDELEIPPIDGVPVMFPSSSSFTLKWPLKKGDGCLLLFAEEGIGSFLKSTVEATADSLAKFSLTDAICIPGLFSFRNVPDNEKATIEVDDNGNVLIDGANIELNGNSKRLVTHAELDTALQTFKTALNLHTHSGVTTGPGVSGTPSAPMSIDISAAETQTVKTGG